MSQGTLIAFDSNVLSYFLQANQAGYDPASDPDPVLAAERVAAFRLFLYLERAFVVPTSALDTQPGGVFKPRECVSG